MGTAAELGRKVSHANHTDLVAVLFSEQCLSAFLLRILDAHNLGLNRVSRLNLAVHEFLNLLDFRRGERRKVREIKAQSVRAHKASSLVHVVAEHLAKRLVEKVGAGVILCRIVTVCRIDFKGNGLADPEHTREHLTRVTDLAAL